jgi:thioredoxin:protein disulfide reductase
MFARTTLGRWTLAALAVAATMLGGRPAHAQFGDVPRPAALVRIEARPLRLTPGSAANATIVLHILHGWHVNANPAASENSIPTIAALTGVTGLGAGPFVYPPPHVVQLPIDDQPLKVWDGDATLKVEIRAGALAPGARTLHGTLRFQACNDQICLPPATLPFDLRVGIAAGTHATGASAGAPDTGASAASETASAISDSGRDAADSAHAPGASAGFAVTPPRGAQQSVVRTPLGDLLAHGGWNAYLTLFLIGLLLNLTPCVYPLIGVTVSIFGARQGAPPLKVFGTALVYVLGMASMYSALGVAAAFSGGLFGGWLSNPIVAVGIGLLLIGLSLSMFGLYEINMPPALLAKLGGANATSLAGIFASGLVVGVFAAPCVGPPVVALLAVVGQRGDPWFGFTSFFTLAMGLGAPYLVLAMFSNLIQGLPRSGEWMLWVKKVFGLILFAVGLHYALLALAPHVAGWVMPAALIGGGVWLGFVDRTANQRAGFRTFKRALGALAAVAGIASFVIAPARGIEFEPLTNSLQPLAAGIRMIDFSADWCEPCHELERVTFTDARVIREARGLKAYHVDLTHYDSREADRWRSTYAIRGVPTIVFLTAQGKEIPGTRVEGFVPAASFLESLRQAHAAR